MMGLRRPAFSAEIYRSLRAEDYRPVISGATIQRESEGDQVSGRYSSFPLIISLRLGALRFDSTYRATGSYTASRTVPQEFRSTLAPKANCLNCLSLTSCRLCSSPQTTARGIKHTSPACRSAESEGVGQPLRLG